MSWSNRITAHLPAEASIENKLIEAWVAFIRTRTCCSLWCQKIHFWDHPGGISLRQKVEFCCITLVIWKPVQDEMFNYSINNVKQYQNYKTDGICLINIVLVMLYHTQTPWCIICIQILDTQAHAKTFHSVPQFNFGELICNFVSREPIEDLLGSLLFLTNTFTIHYYLLLFSVFQMNHSFTVSSFCIGQVESSVHRLVIQSESFKCLTYTLNHLNTIQ